MRKALLLICITFFVVSLNAQTTLWGVCSNRGTTMFGAGTLFRFNTDGTNYKVVYTFEKDGGYSPWSQPMYANDHKLYGTTYTGGNNDYGTIYCFNPENSQYTVLLHFDGENNGSYPIAGLIQATNGRLYGTTSQGGLNGDGVLYEVDPLNGTFTKKIDFNYSSTGCCPWGNLYQAANGKLYQLMTGGLTFIEGGTMIEYDISQNTCVPKIYFNNTNAFIPYGSLIQNPLGRLVGMTNQGGSSWGGIIFQYDLSSNAFTPLISFDGTKHGKKPLGSLNMGFNGNYYGMTEQGGVNDKGVIFRYDPDSVKLVNILDFDGTNSGDKSWGSLMTASNNKMYGFTSQGGKYNGGVIFEYNPETNVFKKIIDLDDSLGTTPYFGALVETPLIVDKEDIVENKFSFNPNPVNDLVTITLPSVNGGNPEIIIYDLNCRKVYYENLNIRQENKELVINIGFLNKGVYFLCIENNKRVQREKLIKN